MCAALRKYFFENSSHKVIPLHCHPTRMSTIVMCAIKMIQQHSYIHMALHTLLRAYPNLIDITLVILTSTYDHKVNSKLTCRCS